MIINWHDEIKKIDPDIKFRANGGWLKTIEELDKSVTNGYSLVGDFVKSGDFEEEYSERYMNTDFVLYQKYTYEDVFRLLNWEKAEVTQNVGGYKYDKYSNTFPVFINYDKTDEEYKNMADMYKMDAEEVKKIVPLENLSEDLAVQQAMKFIKDNAIIK